MSPDEHGERGYYEPGNLMLAVAGVVAAILLGFYCSLLYQTLHTVTHYTEESVPSTVISILDALFVEKEAPENVVKDYFAVQLPYTNEEVQAAILEAEDDAELVGEEIANSFILNRPKIALDYLLGEDLEDVYDYAITKVADGYVEVVLLDVANKPIYPRFCLCYLMNEDGTGLADYNMGRLQPFSRLHEEYSATWNS